MVVDTTARENQSLCLTFSNVDGSPPSSFESPTLIEDTRHHLGMDITPYLAENMPFDGLLSFVHAALVAITPMAHPQPRVIEKPEGEFTPEEKVLPGTRTQTTVWDTSMVKLVIPPQPVERALRELDIELLRLRDFLFYGQSHGLTLSYRPAPQSRPVESTPEEPTPSVIPEEEPATTPSEEDTVQTHEEEEEEKP